MLEERLSNTYNQHTIGGYNLPSQRAPTAPGMYPSISTNPPNGAVENFYTGNTTQESYGRPQSTYHAPPQHQYSVSDRRASVSNPSFPTPDRSDGYDQYPNLPQQAPLQGSWSNDPSSISNSATAGYSGPEQQGDGYKQRPSEAHRTDSWQTAETQHQSQPPVYTGESVLHPVSSAPNVPSQPPTSQTSFDHASTPPTDSHASFYHSNAPHVPPPQQISGQQYPSHPQHFSQQPANQQPAQSVQAQPPYWQAKQHDQVPQQTWQTPPQTYNGYTQDSFPATPHHAPQQKVVEESLIDL